MKLFTELVEDLLSARGEEKKIHLLTQYFESGESVKNKNEALNLFAGINPEKVITPNRLKLQAGELIAYPDWLIERSEKETGNFIKALALLLRPVRQENIKHSSISHWTGRIAQLSGTSDQDIRHFITRELNELLPNQRLFLLQLLTGSFKSPVSEMQLIHAISHVYRELPAHISIRLHELTNKNQLSLNALEKAVDHEPDKIPSPFPVITSMDQPVETLGDASDWQAFGNHEGIEARLIKYEHATIVWTASDRIISDQFPEIVTSCESIGVNFAVHGKIIPKNPDVPIELIIARLHKKSTSGKDRQLAEPVFEIWDEQGLKGNAIYSNPQIITSHLKTKTRIGFSNWSQLSAIHQKCRDLGFSGIQLHKKNHNDHYYFWKAGSYSIKALLMYVEVGSMINSGIQSLTFGLHRGDEVIPVAKVDSFTDAIDLNEIMAFMRSNTVERFGPVRSVKPFLVYELLFDALTRAPRRKAGLSLSKVRIAGKIGHDPNYADTLDFLKSIKS